MNDIVKTLGRPWDLGRISKRKRWPHLFSYGHVELCVCRCRTVTGISVQARHDSIELPTRGTFPARLTYGQITEALNEAGCRWQSEPKDAPGSLELRTQPAGVSFVFRTAESSTPLLEQAGVWINAHDCVPPPPGLPDDGLGM